MAVHCPLCDEAHPVPKSGRFRRDTIAEAMMLGERSDKHKAALAHPLIIDPPGPEEFPQKSS